MYAILVQLHSYNRYIVLALLAFVLIRSLMGWLGKKPYEKIDNATSGALVGFTHLQLLMGLILYFISPFALAGPAATRMSDSWQRYFTAEHLTSMIIAVVLIQLGRTFSKKAGSDEQKHRKLAIYTGIALLIVVATLGYKGLLIGTKGM